MQTHFKYKLRPNKSQSDQMTEWVVTLRKHRNYALRERETGYNGNNLNVDTAVTYAYQSLCDIESRVEYGSCCPLTCAVVKHGVISSGVALTKTKKSTNIKPASTAWDSASGIQQKRTTQLRSELEQFGAIDSQVLQQNIKKLDAAFAGFWKHQRGFPTYRTKANLNSFQYPPKRVKFENNRIYLPGIGWMRFHNSYKFPVDASLGTVVVKREVDGWYISVIIKQKSELPEPTLMEELTSNVGVDVGINKLVSLSDGSHIENPRFATDKAAKRRIRIRQRRVSRKQKGSKNRAKAGVKLAQTHKDIRDKREAYQWRVAKRIVNTAESITHENLKIANMKKRCKPKRSNGRFMPNGQSAKRGLNRAISDAAWGGLFQKIAWLAAKSGKPVFKYEPHFSSQECSKCHHVSKNNRNGEKFICEACGHIDHADTQAARNGQGRIGLKFVSKRRKQPTHESLVPTGGLSESNALCSDSAHQGERNQAENRTSKQTIEPSSYVC